MRPTRFLSLVLLGILASCSSPQPTRKTYALDYTTYPHLPQVPTSTVLRTVVTIVPGLRKQAIYGNYGGPGSKPGQPVDDMDELFRRHDIAYIEGVTLDELYESDRLLVQRLRALDPEDFNWSENLYRLRAIKFFTSPLSKRFGKPGDVRDGTRLRPVVIPGNRLEAESQWNWHGPDPCSDDALRNEPPRHGVAATAPPSPDETETNGLSTWPKAVKFAGRRR